ncbi:MAG: hypothetical protein R3A48_03980 [Polyangiales bacterium]
MTVFIRLTDSSVDNKPAELLESISEVAVSGASRIETFEQNVNAFGSIPGSPFAYWIGDAIRRLFTTHSKLATHNRIAASGGKTNEDFR